jgi:hypothetical protein
MIGAAVLILPASRPEPVNHFPDTKESLGIVRRMGVRFHIASSLLRDSWMGYYHNVVKRRTNCLNAQARRFLDLKHRGRFDLCSI